MTIEDNNLASAVASAEPTPSASNPTQVNAEIPNNIGADSGTKPDTKTSAKHTEAGARQANDKPDPLLEYFFTTLTNIFGNTKEEILGRCSHIINVLPIDKPRSTAEAIFYAQIIISHESMCECARMARKPDQTDELRHESLQLVDKFSRQLSSQLQALYRFRGAVMKDGKDGFMSFFG